MAAIPVEARMTQSPLEADPEAGHESAHGLHRHEDDNTDRDAPRLQSGRHASTSYDAPDSYRQLDDANAQPPVLNPSEGPIRQTQTHEDGFPGSLSVNDVGEAPSRRHSRRLSEASAAGRSARMERRRSSASATVEYDAPQRYGNLDELAVSPVQNPDESPVYRHQSLEETRSREQEWRRESAGGDRQRPGPSEEGKGALPSRVSRIATEIYTISYLILFSILGTLARLGLQALTTYPGAPVAFSSAWYNFAGSFVMGFLAEDRMLFRLDDSSSSDLRPKVKEKANDEERSNGNSASPPSPDTAAAQKAHLALKKTIPLYIGLATGFCGSFTSFSSFIRDAFLALSNDALSTFVPSPTVPRNGGYSFLALLAVILTTTTLSLSGLFIGAHAAIALEPYTPTLPQRFTLPRNLIDRTAVILAVGCWIGAAVLSIVPPDRKSTSPEIERYRPITIALCLAPLGCLARFYLALLLNGRFSSFPLGTFTANIAGTAVLAMAWDLAHVPVGGVAGCQVLRGVEDGFCGCLTTVSTWVAELAALRRGHAYRYGMMSVGVGFGVLVAIMGGLRWGKGYAEMVCGR